MNNLIFEIFITTTVELQQCYQQNRGGNTELQEMNSKLNNFKARDLILTLAIYELVTMMNKYAKHEYNKRFNNQITLANSKWVIAFGKCDQGAL